MKLSLPTSLRSRPGTPDPAATAMSGTPGPAATAVADPPAVPRPLAAVPSPPPRPVAAPDAGESAPAAPPPPGVVLGQVLPIYFVADESHSMRGAPIAAVNQGLLDLRDEVARHPLIGKKVQFSIITFADTAEIRLGLSELNEEMMLPELTPRGRGTSYASALEALRQALPGDVARLKAGGYQVHRPSVFFLTDGQPTEKEERWQTALKALRDSAFKERPNVLAFGVGEAEPTVIAQLASTPGYAFMMADGVSTAGAIAEFATSMLNSMVSSAERLDRGEQTIEFEKPEGFVSLDAPLL